MEHKPEQNQGKAGTVGARRAWWLAGLISLIFLGACSSGIETPEPELATAGSSQGVWHQRLKASLDGYRYTSYSSWMNLENIAATGDLYKLGRDLNNGITSISLAYRETGDRDLARYIKKIMDIAKSKLRDTNGDGFINWRFLHKNADSSSRIYYGTDKHVMDEMMTHSMVAAMAYTLKQAGYSSDASYWTNYLKNHFEKKWRKRSGVSSGFPFMKHRLMHPNTQFIRYHYYMYKLTGQSSYYSEAKRLAGTAKNTMRSSGNGYVWSHYFGSRSGCQRTVYGKYTSQAMVDLASANSGLFDSSFMRKIAYTMAYKVAKSSGVAYDVCGGGTGGSLNTFLHYPFGAAAPWDSSGRLRNAVERAYSTVERYNTSNPVGYSGPAVMTFTLGR